MLETVEQAGPNACPPLIVGVGIGGSLDTVGIAAKKALLRPIGSVNTASHLAELEEDLLDEINRLGIGPQGLGGVVTALAVHVEPLATHIAALPMAVNLNCSAPRRANDRIVMTRTVHAPLDDATVRSLRSGEQIRLTGTIFTARDAAHLRLFEAMKRGEPLPLPLAGQVIYYVGPAPAKPGAPIGACRADHERAHGPIYAATVGAGCGWSDRQGQPL